MDSEPDEVIAESGLPKEFIYWLTTIIIVLIGIAIAEWKPSTHQGWVTLAIVVSIVVELIWLYFIYDLLREAEISTLNKLLWIAVMFFLNIIGALFFVMLKSSYIQKEDTRHTNQP